MPESPTTSDCRQLRLWLLLFAAAACAAVYSLDVRHGFQVYGGAKGQELAWQSVSRLRVFAALHSLFGSLLLLVVSFIGLLLVWAPARALWCAAVIGLLLFYRLDPRFVPVEYWYLLRGALMCALGAAAYPLIILRDRGEGVKGRFVWRQAALAAVFLAGTAAGSLLTSGGVDAFAKELSISAMLYLAGLIAFAVYWGEAAEVFDEQSILNALPQVSLRRTLLPLLLHCAVWLTICFVMLDAPLGTRLLWTAASPLISAGAGIYAAYTWFALEGPPQVFTPAGDASGIIASERARLYLGVLFQYLTVLLLWAVWQAVRGRRIWWLLLAHAALVAYWLPAVWLVQQIGLRAGV